jgi:hypothetical protein
MHAWWSSAYYSVANISLRVVSGDFDGCGKDEIGAFFYNGGTNTILHVWKFNASITHFELTSRWTSSSYTVTNISRRVVSGRFNNDNRYDIGAKHAEGGKYRTHVWLATPNNTFDYQGNIGW